MTISFKPSAYLSALKDDKSFCSEKEIFHHAKEHPQFSYGKVGYTEFSEKYATTGLSRFGRKIIAIPKILWVGIVKTVYHLALAIFLGVPKAFSDKGQYMQARLYCVARDLQGAFGWLVTFFKDSYGQYHVQESSLHKTCYDCFATNKVLDLEAAENAADHFISRIENVETFDYDTVEEIKEQCNSATSATLFVLPTFNPIEGEEPQFRIYDKLLSEDQRLELLMVACKKGVVLHFFSLEKPCYTEGFDAVRRKWMEAGGDGKEVEAAQRSFDISAAFINKCLDKGMVDAEKMNKQLSALAVRYFDSNVTKAVLPSISFEEPNIIKVYSRWGELEDLEHLIPKLDREGITIKLFGAGFMIKACIWKECIAKFTNTTTCKAKIEDCTDDEEIDNNFWQEQSPPKNWSPSWEQMKEMYRNKTSGK